MKGTMKIVAMLLIVLTMAMVVTPVFAYSGVLSNINSAGSVDKTTDANTKLTTISGSIISFIRNLALVIGVVMISILGIKYMMGSAEEKAAYKKTLIPLAVGIILVVAATSIITLVIEFASAM